MLHYDVRIYPIDMIDKGITVCLKKCCKTPQIKCRKKRFYQKKCRKEWKTGRDDQLFPSMSCLVWSSEKCSKMFYSLFTWSLNPRCPSKNALHFGVIEWKNISRACHVFSWTFISFIQELEEPLSCYFLSSWIHFMSNSSQFFPG